MHWAPAVGGARGSWAVGLSQGWQRALGLGDNCSCPSPVCWIGLCYRCHRRPQAKGVPTEPGRLWAHSPRAARNPGRAGPRDSGTALVPGPISPLGSASLSARQVGCVRGGYRSAGGMQGSGASAQPPEEGPWSPHSCKSCPGAWCAGKVCAGEGQPVPVPPEALGRPGAQCVCPEHARPSLRKPHVFCC